MGSTRYKENGQILNEYIGTLKCGIKDGDGQMYLENGVYDGSWKGDKRNGFGIMWFNDHAIYLGKLNLKCFK